MSKPEYNEFRNNPAAFFEHMEWKTPHFIAHQPFNTTTFAKRARQVALRSRMKKFFINLALKKSVESYERLNFSIQKLSITATTAAEVMQEFNAVMESFDRRCRQEHR